MTTTCLQYSADIALEKQQNLISEVTSRLLDGGIGIVPTDTVYGIVSLEQNIPGKERMYRMKNRKKSKKFQILISSLSMLSMLGIIPCNKMKRLAEKFWPGPLTIVCRNIQGETCGLRIPNHKFLLSILDTVNVPIAATSANISGKHPSQSLEEGFADLQLKPDFIVFSSEKNSGTASTVIRLEKDRIVILRKGALRQENLQNFL